MQSDAFGDQWIMDNSNLNHPSFSPIVAFGDKKEKNISLGIQWCKYDGNLKNPEIGVLDDGISPYGGIQANNLPTGVGSWTWDDPEIDIQRGIHQDGLNFDSGMLNHHLPNLKDGNITPSQLPLGFLADTAFNLNTIQANATGSSTRNDRIPTNYQAGMGSVPSGNMLEDFTPEWPFQQATINFGQGTAISPWNLSLSEPVFSLAPQVTNQLFPCTDILCTKSFKRDSDRIRHENSVHLTPTGLHLCPIVGCVKNQGQGYRRADKLTEHMWKKHADLGYTKRT